MFYPYPRIEVDIEYGLSTTIRYFGTYGPTGFEYKIEKTYYWPKGESFRMDPPPFDPNKFKWWLVLLRDEVLRSTRTTGINDLRTVVKFSTLRHKILEPGECRDRTRKTEIFTSLDAFLTDIGGVKAINHEYQIQKQAQLKEILKNRNEKRRGQRFKERHGAFYL